MTIDYKQTLNLPHTDFPMKANLANREPEMLKQWEVQGLSQKLEVNTEGDPLFVLADGPPYANGPIHSGHAVNKILKDFVLKSKRLSGFYAPYIPGWDCHGLPIELQVEKKHGKAGQKLDTKAFKVACRTYATEQIQIQTQAFIRLGVLGRWDKPYTTMDYEYEANILRSMAKVIEKGHLHRGYKPVHWCVDCGSALAEAEVEYENKKSIAIDVAFEMAEKPKTWPEALVDPQRPIWVIIWTTTPWTLPANEAVTIHPDHAYAFVSVPNQAHYYVVATELVVTVAKRLGWDAYEIVSECSGRALASLNVSLKHPFYEKKVPILLGEHVTLDAGTGCVHTAPAHGLEDYHVCMANGMTVQSLVDSKGCFLKDTSIFGGQFVFKANDQVIECLKEQGMLLHQASLEHSYPHCWRHHTPLIFRATGQWFISMDQAHLRHHALEAIDTVAWIPDWGKARIKGMIADRPDWCISRQRTWGVPLALWAHRETGAIHPRTRELMQAIAARIAQQGTDVWPEDCADLLSEAEAKDYEPCIDLLEVWFDSGVSHDCVLRQEPTLRYPADLYLEGSDQHRGWFQTALLSSVAMNGTAPYKQVLTHGFTVDAQGRKMSKSLGNVVSPEAVTQSLGADVLRLWVSSTDYRSEMAISDEMLRQTSDIYRRIRNTARFLLSNLNDFDLKQHAIESVDCLSLDRWIVGRAFALQKEIIESFESYQFHAVYQKIHHFCSVDLGGFYLDVLKDRQYTCKKEGLARRSAQTAMYHIIEALVRWIAPILSFTAEEIWGFLPNRRESSVFLARWYQGFKAFAGDQKDSAWEQILEVRNVVNKCLEEARKADIIGSGLEAMVMLYAEPTLEGSLEKLGDELRFVFITSDAKLYPLSSRPEDAVETSIKGLWIKVQASPHAKCERCWHRREDVNKNAEYPGVCGRCVENVAGNGEQRLYV